MLMINTNSNIRSVNNVNSFNSLACTRCESLNLEPIVKGKVLKCRDCGNEYNILKDSTHVEEYKMATDKKSL